MSRWKIPGVVILIIVVGGLVAAPWIGCREPAVDPALPTSSRSLDSIVFYAAGVLPLDGIPIAQPTMLQPFDVSMVAVTK